MSDYELKAMVISSGMVSEVKRIRNALFRGSSIPPKYPNSLDYETAKYEADFLSKNQTEEWQECLRCVNNDYQRVERLRERINHFLQLGNCIFLTLTFTDETLSKTSPATRRKYVTLYLKSVSDYYVANIDYGAKNGREHYHAIVVADNVDFSSWRKYGNINGRHVRSGSKPDQLAKYVSKLTNHAIKTTNKRCVIIYSKHIFRDYDKNSRHIGGGFIKVDDTWSSIQDDREEIFKLWDIS